jgi:hypothetical protein
VFIRGDLGGSAGPRVGRLWSISILISAYTYDSD